MYEKIQALCTKQGITIKELERKMGFGNGTISKWKDSVPGVLNLKKVADELGTTIDELIK